MYVCIKITGSGNIGYYALLLPPLQHQHFCKEFKQQQQQKNETFPESQ